MVMKMKTALLINSETKQQPMGTAEQNCENWDGRRKPRRLHACNPTLICEQFRIDAGAQPTQGNATKRRVLLQYCNKETCSSQLLHEMEMS